ncbi:Inosose isomerase [Planctopirus ephydatiae]|uniref:Inosose isomerase n=1 Tax=Planctopirus ephydatiae TaxID=2528019 RepID=A0A518GJT9_9PLAN|nr:Inosose isomerase [Planctopirus ephydatiae]
MSRLGLINSAWGQAGRETVWGLQKTKEIGFDTVDLLVDPLDLPVTEKRAIQRELDRLELPLVSICCVSAGLIDPFPSVRTFHLDRAVRHLDLVYELGGENLLLVLGEYIWNREVIPPEEQWQSAVEACQALGAYAGELGLKIALELEPFHLSLLNSVDAMDRFLNDVGEPAVGANIDISHLCLANVPAEELKKLKGRAFHVHISDCDGKIHGDLPPGRGVVQFAPYLEAIREMEIPGAISIELEYSPDPDAIEAWVNEAYQSTRKLLQQSGLS